MITISMTIIICVFLNFKPHCKFNEKNLLQLLLQLRFETRTFASLCRQVKQVKHLVWNNKQFKKNYFFLIKPKYFMEFCERCMNVYFADNVRNQFLNPSQWMKIKNVLFCEMSCTNIVKISTLFRFVITTFF